MDASVAAIEDGGELIWGIAANPGTCCDNDPWEFMTRTLAIAEHSGNPMLYGARRGASDWPVADQLKLLRPGNVLTYCFSSGLVCGTVRDFGFDLQRHLHVSSHQTEEVRDAVGEIWRGLTTT